MENSIFRQGRQTNKDHFTALLETIKTVQSMYRNKIDAERNKVLSLLEITLLKEFQIYKEL